MAKSKKRGKSEYTHLEMEAALCVWECLNEWTLSDIVNGPGRAEWIELRDGIGSVELRHQSIVLGKWCLSIYDILNGREFFDGVSYDWDVIPMMLGYALKGGRPAIYEGDLPDPFSAAQLVAHEHLLNEYVRSCRDEAQKQWSYGDLTEDHGDRLPGAFASGQEPAEFISWLGEKYDLHAF